jgi:hypothetical protein
MFDDVNVLLQTREEPPLLRGYYSILGIINVCTPHSTASSSRVRSEVGHSDARYISIDISTISFRVGGHHGVAASTSTRRHRAVSSLLLRLLLIIVVEA